MKKIKLSQTKINLLFAVLITSYLSCAVAVVGTYGASFAIIERIREAEAQNKHKVFEPFGTTISGAGVQRSGDGLAGVRED